MVGTRSRRDTRPLNDDVRPFPFAQPALLIFRSLPEARHALTDVPSVCVASPPGGHFP